MQSLLVSNYSVQAIVDELRCRCRFGMRAADDGEGSWVVDEEGCADVLPLDALAAHEAACGFELLTCAHASVQVRWLPPLVHPFCIKRACAGGAPVKHAVP